MIEVISNQWLLATLLKCSFKPFRAHTEEGLTVKTLNFLIECSSLGNVCRSNPAHFVTRCSGDVYVCFFLVTSNRHFHNLFVKIVGHIWNVLPVQVLLLSPTIPSKAAAATTTTAATSAAAATTFTGCQRGNVQQISGTLERRAIWHFVGSQNIFFPSWHSGKTLEYPTGFKKHLALWLDS